jgi:hypothetical protein
MYGELHDEAFYLDLKPALAVLEALKETANDDPAEPSQLSTTKIELVPNVFQVRGLGINEYHVGDLVSVLRRGGDLDPILVWRCGKHALMLDGHHRKAAYERFQIEQKQPRDIPVKWFHGSALEAMKSAAEANARFKLQMTPDQRNDLAWKMTVAKLFTKAETASLSGVSVRHVGNMRQTLKALGDDAEGCATWKKAMAKARASGVDISEEDLEAKMEAQVDAWAFRMTKTFGDKLQKNPEFFARVVDRYAGRMAPEVFKAMYQVSQFISETDLEDLQLNPEF